MTPVGMNAPSVENHGPLVFKNEVSVAEAEQEEDLSSDLERNGSTGSDLALARQCQELTLGLNRCSWPLGGG